EIGDSGLIEYRDQGSANRGDRGHNSSSSMTMRAPRRSMHSPHSPVVRHLRQSCTSMLSDSDRAPRKGPAGTQHASDGVNNHRRFGRFDALVEALGRIVGQHLDGGLRDYRTGIDPVVDEKQGGAAYLDAIGHGLGRAVGARKRRTQRGMSVHYPAREA